MLSRLRAPHGFSLIELLMVITVAATIMAISVPALMDLSEGSKLNAASREVERELQSARLRAVSVNRTLRVRLNCPGAGYFRTVEYLGNLQDTATDRCLLSAFPYPAADTELSTRPNYDGPLRILPVGATVTSRIIEFRSDGTAYDVVSGVPVPIGVPLELLVTRKGKAKKVTVNAAGKIQLEQDTILVQ